MIRDMEEITAIMREMILEIGELKERVFSLEQVLYHSAESREAWAASPALTETEKIQLQGESFENLGRLYTSGYHVCTGFFGEQRDGDCLFCVSLLEKR